MIQLYIKRSMMIASSKRSVSCWAYNVQEGVRITTDTDTDWKQRSCTIVVQSATIQIYSDIYMICKLSSWKKRSYIYKSDQSKYLHLHPSEHSKSLNMGWGHGGGGRGRWVWGEWKWWQLGGISLAPNLKILIAHQFWITSTPNNYSIFEKNIQSYGLTHTVCRCIQLYEDTNIMPGLRLSWHPFYTIVHSTVHIAVL